MFPNIGLTGRRVRLIHCSDPYTKLMPGITGTVRFIDSAGSLFIDWDSGDYLGLLPGVDLWEVLPQEDCAHEWHDLGGATACPACNQIYTEW